MKHNRCTENSLRCHRVFFHLYTSPSGVIYFPSNFLFFTYSLLFTFLLLQTSPETMPLFGRNSRTSGLPTFLLALVGFASYILLVSATCIVEYQGSVYSFGPPDTAFTDPLLDYTAVVNPTLTWTPLPQTRDRPISSNAVCIVNPNTGDVYLIDNNNTSPFGPVGCK